MKRRGPQTPEELLGMCIRQRRNELGISQEELAHRAGLHRTYIGDIERGNRNVSLRNLIKLAKALDTTVTSLLKAFDKQKFDIPDCDG